ncbi:MAG: YfiT family bacillithiol transferase [Bacteroidota bacterium]
MTDIERTQLQYPIGKAVLSDTLTPEERVAHITTIEMAPGKIRKAVEGLNSEQLDTPYRPEGWTVRQVVHHMPDSHMNSYVRFRWALTEEDPMIKAYDEKGWAMLPDGLLGPIGVSLRLLDALHARWAALLRNMKEDDFARTLQHPEGRTYTLDKMLGLYAWHCEHHIAHITSLRARNGW